MTRTATGIASGIAAIIVFVGAFLLSPQAGYAQEIPDCDGDEETFITATGVVTGGAARLVGVNIFGAVPDN